MIPYHLPGYARNFVMCVHLSHSGETMGTDFKVHVYTNFKNSIFFLTDTVDDGIVAQLAVLILQIGAEWRD